ncbi:F-box protein, partial [Klebsiella pneumoniae]
MAGLPEEIIVHIFSFLPVSFVFKSVSLVCKDFRRIAYDQHIVKN